MPDIPLTFVALTTTGPSPEEDKVVEAAVVRALAGKAEEEFVRLANPGGLSPAALQVAGLEQAAVAGKPQPRSVLRQALKFCGAGLVVVYDADAFGAFLRAAGVEAPACLDARRLALITRPQATDYSLAGIAADLGLPAPAGRRAMEKARLVAAVWFALLDELGKLPLAARHLICRLAETAVDPLAPVLADAAHKGGFELTSDPEAGLRALFPDQSELFRRVQKSEEVEPTDEALPTDGICRMFQTAGAIGKAMEDYEQRPQQVEMVEAVCEALNEPHHLMVEAGTGTGKSMAYLVPAIAWACTNHDKVVVSTNTRNLQEQLYHKDLPLLSRLLPGRFEPALLKGRRNYLCVRRFLHVVSHFERELSDPEEVMALAPLVAWAARTESGDLAECNGFLFSPAAPAVMQAVTTGPDECAGRGCRFRSRCKVNRARALAQLADLIVVNHALLFAEIGLDSRVLPPHRCLVFDEAHNLEDVATEALATVVDVPGIFRITRFLYRSQRDGSGSGLLATVMYEADRNLPKAAQVPVRDGCGRAMDAVQEVVDATRQFFDTLAAPFFELPPQMDRVMLEECHPAVGPGSETWDAAQALRETIRKLGEKVEELCGMLEGAAGDSEDIVELVNDLRSQTALMRAFGDAVEFVLKQEAENFVYWLERVTRDRATFYSVHAAPLQIGPYIRDFFLKEKRCVIFTSATLQVDDTFDYMLERLGAGEPGESSVRCLSVGSPFDYARQTMFGVTTFLPDPGGRRDKVYDAELSSFLVDLLKQTRGRALVLFTSYSLLEAVYEVIRDPLARAGICVLAQGHGGSREAITALFRTDVSSVLLGTRSFWEGVDISGETLSCLVLTKLPFHVFTDPLVRGRTEYLRSIGRDPFTQYTLPEAVISFRQGAGRLIRRRTDMGVVIITDRRLVTKGYGRSFLSSLPTRHAVLRDRQEALRAVGEFLERGGGDA
jgi:predicted DnaQ family exonuclease/DinG family helicase